MQVFFFLICVQYIALADSVSMYIFKYCACVIVKILNTNSQIAPVTEKKKSINKTNILLRKHLEKSPHMHDLCSPS